MTIALIILCYVLFAIQAELRALAEAVVCAFGEDGE